MNNDAFNFLSTLHSQLEGEEVLCLRSITPDGEPTQFFTNSIEKAAQWADLVKDDANAYVGVCPRLTPDNGKVDNVGRSYWLWADLDGYKLNKTIEQLQAHLQAVFPLEPAIVVASGPQGLHLYWPIEPTTDLRAVKVANNAVADALRSDKVGDVARILRIAGTYNHKGDKPVPVELLKATKFVPYKLEDVRAFANLTVKLRRLIGTGDITGYPSRSERDFAVVTALAEQGASENFIERIFLANAIGDKARENLHSLTFTINKVFEQQELKEEAKWGIVEKDDAYWRIIDNGLMQLSTFVFEPEVVLQGIDDTDTMFGAVRSGGRVWPNVAFSRKAFAKVDTLTKELPRVEWQWLGKDMDVKRLLPYLLDKLLARFGRVPFKRATNVLGRHDNLLVLDGQVYDANGPVQDSNVVWLSTGREHPQVGFGSEADSRELEKFLNCYFRLNKFENVVAALGWTVAAMFKPQLEKAGAHFPVLNLYGTRGSGKTTLLTDVLQPLSGYLKPRAYDANTTNFVLLSLLGSVNCFPVALSEWRRSSMKDPDRIIRLILLSYDGSSDARGRADQTTVVYPLLAPFTIDGEDPIVDPACMERIVQLNMRPETIAEDTDAYNAFLEMQEVDLNAVSYMLWQWALSHTLDFEAGLAELKAELKTPLPDRVKRNFAVVVAGFRAFQQFCYDMGFDFNAANVEDEKVGLNVAQALMPLIEEVVRPELGRTLLLVDDFIEDVVGFLALEQDDQFLYKYEEATSSLFLNVTSAYNWWTRERRNRNKPVLEKTAIRAQLRERMAMAGMQVPGMYVTWFGTKNFGPGKGLAHACEINLTLAKDAGLDIPQLTRGEPIVKAYLDDNKEKQA